MLSIAPAAAQKDVESLEKLSQKFADSSDCAIAAISRRYLPVLKAVSQRIEDGEQIETPLKKMFADPLVADVWMVEKQDGSRFYVKSEPNLKQSENIQYIITFDGNTKGTIVREDDLKYAGRAAAGRRSREKCGRSSMLLMRATGKSPSATCLP